MGDSGEMRWSGSLQRGTWSSVTAGSTPPTPGAMAADAAAVGEAEADAASGERCCMAVAGSESRGHGDVCWRLER